MLDQFLKIMLMYAHQLVSFNRCPAYVFGQSINMIIITILDSKSQYVIVCSIATHVGQGASATIIYPCSLGILGPFLKLS